MLQNFYMWHDIFASQKQSPHKSKKICVKPLNLVLCQSRNLSEKKGLIKIVSSTHFISPVS